MNLRRSSLLLIAVAAASIINPTLVDGHGYLYSPRARNVVAGEDGVWSDGGPTDMDKDSDPMSLNKGGTLAQCGISPSNGGRNYDYPLNVFDELLDFKEEAIYARGQVIQVDVVLTAHHMGHFEFRVCPIAFQGEIPSADCFVPLEFVEDVLYGAPKDPNYIERAYIPPRSAVTVRGGIANFQGDFFSYKMKLPPSVAGNTVLLQWHYYTANTCAYDGYASYPFPSNWNAPAPLNVCTTISEDGLSAPEQFWNCAEVIITDAPIVPTTPAPLPEPSTAAPMLPSSYGYPTASPDSSDQPCGNGSIGNGICPDPIYPCCSPSGWCGNSIDYCGTPPSPTPPPPTSTAAPVVPATTAPTGAVKTTSSPTSAIGVPATTAPTDTAKTTSSPTGFPSTVAPIPPIPVNPSPTPIDTGSWVADAAPRCGTSELDARGNCGKKCTSQLDCAAGEWCWTVHWNYCEYLPKPFTCFDNEGNTNSRCGTSELLARELCGVSCTSSSDCPGANNYCLTVHTNFCDCHNAM